MNDVRGNIQRTSPIAYKVGQIISGVFADKPAQPVQVTAPKPAAGTRPTITLSDDYTFGDKGGKASSRTQNKPSTPADETKVLPPEVENPSSNPSEKEPVGGRKFPDRYTYTGDPNNRKSPNVADPKLDPNNRKAPNPISNPPGYTPPAQETLTPGGYLNNRGRGLGHVDFASETTHYQGIGANNFSNHASQIFNLDKVINNSNTAIVPTGGRISDAAVQMQQSAQAISRFTADALSQLTLLPETVMKPIVNQSEIITDRYYDEDGTPAAKRRKRSGIESTERSGIDGAEAVASLGVLKKGYDYFSKIFNIGNAAAIEAAGVTAIEGVEAAAGAFGAGGLVVGAAEAVGGTAAVGAVATGVGIAAGAALIGVGIYEGYRALGGTHDLSDVGKEVTQSIKKFF